MRLELVSSGGFTIFLFSPISQAAHCVSSFEPYEIRVSIKFRFSCAVCKLILPARLSLVVTTSQEITRKLRKSGESSRTKTSTSLLSTTTLRYWNWSLQCSTVLELAQHACRVEPKTTSRISWLWWPDGDDSPNGCRQHKLFSRSLFRFGRKKTAWWLVTDLPESLTTWCAVDTPKANVTGTLVVTTVSDFPNVAFLQLSRRFWRPNGDRRRHRLDGNRWHRFVGSWLRKKVTARDLHSRRQLPRLDQQKAEERMSVPTAVRSSNEFPWKHHEQKWNLSYTLPAPANLKSHVIEQSSWDARKVEGV